MCISGGKLRNFGVSKQLYFANIELRKGKIDLLGHFLSSMSTKKVSSKPQNSVIAPSNLCMPRLFDNDIFIACKMRGLRPVKIDIFFFFYSTRN